ncbi:MAG: response regulator [Bacteroidota bacterium]
MAHVLIIDDSLELLEMYSLIFKMNKIESSVAANHTQMVRQMTKIKPDIILMDVMLNGEDGREICRELKENSYYKDIPVILISASPNKLKEFKDFNANDCLEKPFDIEKLITKINTHLPHSA